MNHHSAPYSGQCLCGAIKYAVKAFSSQMGHCHCSMCRKFSGAAFATFGEARVEDFSWLQGQDQLKDYIADNGSKRSFCPHCGSSLLFSPSNDAGKVLEIALGTLNIPAADAKELSPDVHIFVDSKASWFDINDELPQFESHRQSPRIK